MRPLLLDLFCGAGGAAMGYNRAGFDVVGIDISPQPRYPFPFIQADALNPPVDLSRFAAIHASPPCQELTRARHLRSAQGGTVRVRGLNLIPETRELLLSSGLPYVIENVEDAAPYMRSPACLCGSSFGLKVRRHRLFESSFPLLAPSCRHGEQGRPVGVYHVLGDQVPHGGKTAETLEEAQDAMGIDWMPWNQLKEAIPPAYTEYLAQYLLAEIAY